MSPGSLLLAQVANRARVIVWEALAGSGDVGTRVLVSDVLDGTPMLALFSTVTAGSDYVLVLVMGRLGYVARACCQEVVS